MSRTTMNQSIDIRAYLRPGDADTKAEHHNPFSFSLFQRISDAERAEFCTQLSVMLQAKVPLHRALEVLKIQTKNEKMKAVVGGLLGDIQKGLSFSKALARQPQVFDELFVTTAEVGQESGMLGEVMGSLSEHLEKMSALKKKLVQAMTYPVLVVLVALTAVSFLLVFIVPTFAEMFRSFQMELPWSTEIVLQVSDLFTSYGHLAVLGFLAAALLAKKALKTSEAKNLLEHILLKTPFIGGVILKNYIARFCRTLGTQLHAQVSLVDALITTQRIISNPALRSEIGEITRVVRQGQAIATPVTVSKLFPPMVAQMITVGEETSELDRMLLKVAEYYEKEIDGKVEQLSSLIEPVIVLVLGLVVAAILVAMYLPMFDLVNVIGG